MNKLKNKLSKSNINFAKNIVTSIIVPVVILVAALIIGIVFGFNKGMDFNGGVMVSVVAEEYNLEESEDYTKFKSEVDTILQKNGVSGSVYLTEKHTDYQDDILVVKINYNGNNAEKVVEGIKSDLVSKFYSGEETRVEQNHLVEVSTFGASVDSWIIFSTILATLVAVIAICVYVSLRTLSVYAPVMALISSVVSAVLTIALGALCRIQINAFTLAVVPLVAIVSALATFIYINSTKKLLKTGDYERKTNYVLANDSIKNSMHVTIYITLVACLMALIFAFANVTSLVSHFGLATFVSILAVCYTYTFIIPAIFGATFVRKIKKEKVKAKQTNQKLDEKEVLKETDLDNLVSN